jgi:DNA-binding transcriptional ArsR family regulator
LHRGVYIIKDPDVAKLLADDTRRHILHALSNHEMSATDLAKSFKKSHSSIVYHLNALKDAGLIEVTHTEKVRNMMQDYYRSVSRDFHVSYSLNDALAGDPDFTAWQEVYVQRMFDGLDAYNIRIPEEKKEKVMGLLRTCYLREKKAFEERMTQRSKPRRIGRYAGRNLAHILSHMQLLKDPVYLDAIKELSNIIDDASEELT